jgi:hypothetical protein
MLVSYAVDQLVDEGKPLQRLPEHALLSKSGSTSRGHGRMIKDHRRDKVPPGDCELAHTQILWIAAPLMHRLAKTEPAPIAPAGSG